MKLYKDHSNIDTRKMFFTNHVVDIRNTLPETVVCSHSLSIFKRRLANFTLNKFVNYNWLFYHAFMMMSVVFIKSFRQINGLID